MAFYWPFAVNFGVNNMQQPYRYSHPFISANNVQQNGVHFKTNNALIKQNGYMRPVQHRPTNIKAHTLPITVSSPILKAEVQMKNELSSNDKSTSSSPDTKSEESFTKTKPFFRPWLKETARNEAATAKTPPACANNNIAILSHNNDKSSDEEEADNRLLAMETMATNLGKSIMGHRCIYCGKMYSRK
jgi:hypothetical protein